MVEKLLQMAWAARSRAYAPYSKFQVGAAIETASGHIFDGCNVEVANYGCTLCAERTAIVKAVSEGALLPGGLKKVVVAAITQEPTAPCGSCRQMIEEFADPADCRIYLSRSPDKIDLELQHAVLLPYSFNGSALRD